MYENLNAGCFRDKENSNRKGVLNCYVSGERPGLKTRYRIQFELHNLVRGMPGVNQ